MSAGALIIALSAVFLLIAGYISWGSIRIAAATLRLTRGSRGKTVVVRVDGTRYEIPLDDPAAGVAVAHQANVAIQEAKARAIKAA